jgi:hypothetical protein
MQTLCRPIERPLNRQLLDNRHRLLCCVSWAALEIRVHVDVRGGAGGGKKVQDDDGRAAHKDLEISAGAAGLARVGHTAGTASTYIPQASPKLYCMEKRSVFTSFHTCVEQA